MANYRFYVLDKDDHVREPPQVFECRSDEVAVEKAVQLLNGRVIEVWDHSRRVVRLEPTGKRQNTFSCLIRRRAAATAAAATCNRKPTILTIFVCSRPHDLPRWRPYGNPLAALSPKPKFRISAKGSPPISLGPLIPGSETPPRSSWPLCKAFSRSRAKLYT